MVPQVCDSGVSKGQKGGPAVQPLFKINPISCGRRFEDSGIECCKKLKLFGVFGVLAVRYLLSPRSQSLSPNGTICNTYWRVVHRTSAPS